MSKNLRLILIQHRTAGDVKEDNVQYVLGKIRAAVADEKRTSVPILVVLPELFNSPYGPSFFDKYAEAIPEGYTSKALSAVAKELGIFIIGGSYPERDAQNPKTLYNTCTVWNPKGEMIGKHRKVHLYDIEVPGKVTFKESSAMTPGKNFTIVEIGPAKIGIGICFDIEFDEFARVYRNEGCNFLVYPAAFPIYTGELHWELYQRARAADTQSYVTMVSASRDYTNPFVNWGYTMLVDPWARVVKKAGEEEEIIKADLDFSIADSAREQLPCFRKRRTDMYEVVAKVPLK
ncbi:omega-amidase NIT2-like [Phlebotomus argentipes]|uniref:omega-amidase NIT2-like n=1 Tax=Phlebotomus argentipes TaxID=94469 RepID=UPI00289302E6|nr:omega-amidase NIT2-like [Phlebotomus argentipes]